MTTIDQFESVFRAASKAAYSPGRLRVESALVVTDLPRAEAASFAERTAQFLRGAAPRCKLDVVAGDEFKHSGELLQRIEAGNPSLVCTYRNLHSADFAGVHSLGEHLDVLTQVAPTPVLVVPNPRIEADQTESWVELGTARVMAVTDHLSGDGRLIDWAVGMCGSDGELLLAHIQDDASFKRFIDVIAKIPAIETATARQLIAAQLLKEPTDYIRSIKRALKTAGIEISVTALVTMGHRLADYKRLVTQHRASLVVINTRDDEQLAMHGLAYPLAVELRDVPMLML